MEPGEGEITQVCWVGEGGGGRIQDEMTIKRGKSEEELLCLGN